MALKKCKECGEGVSKKATKCPKCGSPQKKPTSIGTWLGVVLIGLVIYSYKNIDTTQTNPVNQKAAKTSTTAPQKQVKPKWSTTTSKNKMTEEVSMYASSPSANNKEMKFPFSDVNAWIGVGCKNGKNWAYIGFDSTPILATKKNHDGYSTFTTRVKWDDKIVKTQFSQSWGEDFISFDSDDDAINYLKNSSSMLLEMQWHGEQPVFFKFSLNGSTAALNKIEKDCSR